MAYTQEGKPMRVKSPLGKDVLLIERLNGSDGVSRPFELTLDLLSENALIDPKALLMKAMVVTVDLPAEGIKRYFHGLVKRFSQGGMDDDGLVSYRAEVVPWLWFLSLTTECRIFQHKTAPEIIEQVFKDLGMTDFELQLQGTYLKRDYCVQYRETNLDFVSRLMEEEGIFYFFTHTADKHMLVLADALAAFKPGIVPKLSCASKEAGQWGEQYISDIEMESQFTPGKVTLTDYNFETPAVSLLANMATTVTLAGNSKFELYDFPGNYGKKADGDRFGRIRMEEQETHYAAIRGDAVCRGLVSGTKFEVDDYYRRDVNKTYHLISVDHSGMNGGYRSKHTSSGEEFQFSERFTGILNSVHFRPPRITPKAIVRGSQTAVVVGPGGEEIYVDKYGRVKVQFFWDRQGKKNEDSSCWVRVSSTWAGKNWGFIQIPRIGQEVIVDFLEGDPDRPIITGSVYNAEQMPPYALPANMTQSGVKTRSSSKGSETTFNELRFEDSKGKEELFIHAEKDQKIEVENDETHWVGHDRKKTVDNDETNHIKMNRIETVDKDETITIHGNRTETVDKDETITITQGNHKHTVEKGTQTFIVEGNRAITIRKGNDTLKVDTGNRVTELSKGNYQTKIGMGNVDTKVDMGNVTLKAGLGAIKYEAMQGIELKVGANSIKVDQTGVTIKGLMVKIEGSVMTEVKGLMTNIKADAILMVKGSLTMIN